MRCILRHDVPHRKDSEPSHGEGFSLPHLSHSCVDSVICLERRSEMVGSKSRFEWSKMDYERVGTSGWTCSKVSESIRKLRCGCRDLVARSFASKCLKMHSSWQPILLFNRQALDSLYISIQCFFTSCSTSCVTFWQGALEREAFKKLTLVK